MCTKTKLFTMEFIKKTINQQKSSTHCKLNKEFFLNC